LSKQHESCQAVLARRLGKRRIVAETGAGQHGVATATVCARFGFDCVVYMGAEDMRRQAPNVERMGLLGAEVRPVEFGTKTLKEATSEAIRDWITNVETTHYLIGSCVGPAVTTTRRPASPPAAPSVWRSAPTIASVSASRPRPSCPLARRPSSGPTNRTPRSVRIATSARVAACSHIWPSIAGARRRGAVVASAGLAGMTPAVDDRGHPEDGDGLGEVGPDPGPVAHREPVGRRQRAPWRRRAGRRPIPVPYTHLRAHETPEPLVCRLLLEK